MEILFEWPQVKYFSHSYLLNLFSFPGKAVGVRIAGHAAPAEATPAKEAEKVYILTLQRVLFII